MIKSLPFAALAMTAALIWPAAAQEAASSDGAPFTLPDLPYAADALAPVIDAETMTLHHDRHHQSYVDNLNAAVEEDEALQGQSLEDLVAAAGTLSDRVRNNAGGHWNHSFFWEIMAPTSETGEPSEELAAAIDEAFGSMDAMKEEFNTAGADRFGSGWAWLIVTEEGELAVTSTPNQDNPLMDVAEEPGTPVLGNDVWEHAYYITYNNRRADYLEAWWDVVNWEQASENFAAATAE